MASKTPDLPIQWELPRAPASWWFVVLVPVLNTAALALAALHRHWFSAILPVVVFLIWWDRLTEKRPERYEITYAAAYPPWALYGVRSIEWGRVRRVEIAADAIRLYRSKLWSPVLLKLPEDPELRVQIIAAVRVKSKCAPSAFRTCGSKARLFPRKGEHHGEPGARATIATWMPRGRRI